MKRLLVAPIVALALVLAVGTAMAASAGAQTVPEQVPTQEIIPEPNSGRAPDEAGDRGGALQLLLLAAVVVGVGGVVLHVTRQARAGPEGDELSRP